MAANTQQLRKFFEVVQLRSRIIMDHNIGLFHYKSSG